MPSLRHSQPLIVVGGDGHPKNAHSMMGNLRTYRFLGYCQNGHCSIDLSMDLYVLWILGLIVQTGQGSVLDL